MALNGKNILLGVTGSIAAYKAIDLTSMLRKEGADPHIVMTQSACRFAAPAAFETISRNPVHLDAFDDARWEPEHTRLADDADLAAVIPATANMIAKFAHGIADDLLSTLLTAVRCPVLVAPAMNVHMYESPIAQANLRALTDLGVVVAEPETGQLACGYEGVGRLQSVERLLEALKGLEARSFYRSGVKRDMAGLRALITAGPTREPVDPVRFVSNRSSGKMGYAMAEAAHARGAQVTLVSGPVGLPVPRGVEYAPAETAREMLDAVMRRIDTADIAVFAAAVADYEPVEAAADKIKKEQDLLTLTLRKTPDIALEAGRAKGNRFLIGFAAETNALPKSGVQNARRKLTEKNLDMIVLNDITQQGAGFDVDTNIVTLLDRKGGRTDLPLMSKRAAAHRIFDAALSHLPGEIKDEQTDADRSRP